jgi:murein DD-endopeptidase MepM/ murein hydrolase activator NlpD
MPTEICSPLAEIALPELAGHVSNPYSPPPIGSDHPHQGLDLAIFQPGTSIALAGQPVSAIFTGQVAGVIRDRFPYGNAVLIETAVDTSMDPYPAFPTALPAILTPSVITCPPLPSSFRYDHHQRSLYILYAHLKDNPIQEPGEKVNCGDLLGKIGNSGNALNPHLHIEIRIGPAGAQFPSMAHYDSSASSDEMALYCTWRVSGLFQSIDPLQFLNDNFAGSGP